MQREFSPRRLGLSGRFHGPPVTAAPCFNCGVVVWIRGLLQGAKPAAVGAEPSMVEASSSTQRETRSRRQTSIRAALGKIDQLAPATATAEVLCAALVDELAHQLGRS